MHERMACCTRLRPRMRGMHERMACCTRLRPKMRGMLERGSHGLLHAATPEDARHA